MIFGAKNLSRIKPFTEVGDLRKQVVGERSKCSEVEPEGLVECLEVRMPV